MISKFGYVYNSYDNGIAPHLYYSPDNGVTFKKLEEIHNISEKIINTNTKIDSPNFIDCSDYSLTTKLHTTKRQRKKMRRSWNRLISRFDREIRRAKRLKEKYRRQALKNYEINKGEEVY